MIKAQSKEMKMTNTPGAPSVTTQVPFQPKPAPVPMPGSTGTAAAPKISITNTDPRQIDNLRLSANFLINGQPYYDYEDHGTFNQVGVDGLSGENGKWNGSQWAGNFLHTEGSQSIKAFVSTLNQALTQASVATGGNEDTWPNAVPNPVYPEITIVNEDGRGITGLRVTADFTINGQPYTDYEDIGNFDRHYFLVLNGMNGKWNGTKWVGNFLATKGSGFDTQIDPSLLAFLNALVTICMVGNVIAAAKGVSDQIRGGVDGENLGGAPGAGFKLSQVW
jgi:hypothetical protein